jgi:hypothetical protein
LKGASAFGPLSEAPLWRWSRQFYEREAADAWAKGKVPWRITNSVHVANAYARIISAWRRDLLKPPDVPVQILELGGGSGRLAFHLTRALEQARVPYQLTWSDAASSSVEAFRGRRFVHQRPGVVESMRLDAIDEPLGPPMAPDVVIAQYLFDSLPHDAWMASGRALHVSVELPEGDAPECERAQLSWQETDVPVPPFVRGYAKRVGSGAFMVPVGAFRCLQRIASWSSGRCLVLVADKGEASLSFSGETQLQRHGGGISARVNFDALKAWWGWRPFLSSGDAELGFYGLASGATSLAQTRFAWAEVFGSAGPLAELRALDAFLAAPQSPIALLAMLEAWEFDPDVFVRMAEPLRGSTFQPLEVAVLVEAIDRCWANHYELGGAMDVAFEMATVLHRAGQLTHATRFYERSLASHGRHATVCFNLALCRLDLGQTEQGTTLLREVLTLAPEHAGANRVLASFASSPR